MSQKAPQLLNVMLRPMNADREGLVGAACATLRNKNFSGTRLETEQVNLEVVTLGNERVVKLPIVNINERFTQYFCGFEDLKEQKVNYFTPVEFTDTKTIATVLADCSALLTAGRQEFCQVAMRVCNFWNEFAPTDVFPAVDFTSAGPTMTQMFYNSSFWTSGENLVPFRSEHLGYVYELLGDAVSWLAWSGDIERLHRAVILGYSLIQNITQNKADRRVFQAKLSYALRLAMRYATFLLEKSITDGKCYYLRHLTVVAYLLRHAPLVTFEEHQSLIELRGQIERIIAFSNADFMSPLEEKSTLTDLVDPIKEQAPLVAKAAEFFGNTIRTIPARVPRRRDRRNVGYMAQRLEAHVLRTEFFKLYAQENSVDISTLDCVTLQYPKNIFFRRQDEDGKDTIQTHLTTGRRIEPFNFAPVVPVNLNWSGSWAATTDLSDMIDRVWDCSVVKQARGDAKEKKTQVTGIRQLNPLPVQQTKHTTHRAKQAAQVYKRLPRYEPGKQRTKPGGKQKRTSYASALGSNTQQ